MRRIQRSIGFTLILAAFFLILYRFFLQSWFPVIGDEAYYFYWSHHLAGGYYDLPPMIGWLQSLLSVFSDEPLWLRLSNSAVIIAVVMGMQSWLKTSGEREKALPVSLLYLLSPLPFFAVFISHDVALLLFTFFSAYVFYRAYTAQRSPWMFLLSGVLWGAAFLSKYFALFVLPFYLIWHFSRDPKFRTKRAILWFTLGAAPFLIQHLYWNARHCWSNFVFNLVIRQQVDDGPIYLTFGLFLIYLLILITPIFWMDLFRSPVRKWFQGRNELERFFLGMWLVPILQFAITAILGRGQGLHWYLPYLPFFFLWIGMRFSFRTLELKLERMILLNLGLSLLVYILFAYPGRILAPLVSERFPLEYRIAFHGKEWAEIVANELNTSIWGETDLVVADGYSQASVLDHELRKYFLKNFFKHQSGLPPIAVWGAGSRFGRVFDWTVNFNEYEGKNLAFVTRSLTPSYDWEQFFEESRISQKELRGQKFWIYLGRGFKAKRYVAQVMIPTWKNHYPDFFLQNWIPSRCELKEDRR